MLQRRVVAKDDEVNVARWKAELAKMPWEVIYKCKGLVTSPWWLFIGRGAIGRSGVSRSAVLSVPPLLPCD